MSKVAPGKAAPKTHEPAGRSIGSHGPILPLFPAGQVVARADRGRRRSGPAGTVGESPCRGQAMFREAKGPPPEGSLELARLCAKAQFMGPLDGRRWSQGQFRRRVGCWSRPTRGGLPVGSTRAAVG